MMRVLVRVWATARARKRVDMGECIGVFEGMHDEVAVSLPVVIDAVVSEMSALLDAAVSNETNNNR